MSNLTLNTIFIDYPDIPRWILVKGNMQTRVAINSISHRVVTELESLGWVSRGFEVPINKSRCSHETKMQD